MSTKPMKALVALASIALLGSLVNAGSAPALASGVCGLTPVDASSPGTAGTSSNPWKVNSAADFALVGAGDCLLSGHYLQTASFSVDTSTAAGRVDDGDNAGMVIPFSGVYNGGHWTTTLEGNRPLFSTVSGTIKKLKLGGELESIRTGFTQPGDDGFGSMAKALHGGTISEVGSSVTIRSSLVNGSSDFIGGLIGLSQESGLIQYSFYSGEIEVVLGPTSSGAKIGGLVGQGEGSLWIRDSYGLARIEYDKTVTVSAGGIVGYFLGNKLNLVRTYAAGSFTVNAPCPDPCNPETNFFGEGGLVGEANDMAKVQLVSAFWLSTTTEKGIGRLVKTGDIQPLQYSTAPQSAPVAVRVDAQTLRTSSTFQSRGDNSGPFGASTGENSLPTGDSTPGATPSANDYRWAIESGNVETFVAQRRVDTANDNAGAQRVVGETLTFTRAFDRLLWTNPAVPTATYSTRGVSETVGGYPALGRVWEMCADENNGFPVLVWEDRNCPGEGAGGGGDNSAADQARAAGLSGAELTAFLASGLTLEQWLAQRLAATGTPGEALGLGVAIAGLLAMVGLSLVFLRRRTNAGPV